MIAVVLTVHQSKAIHGDGVVEGDLQRVRMRASVRAAPASTREPGGVGITVNRLAAIAAASGDGCAELFA